MLDYISPKSVLFIDVETVPMAKDFDQLDRKWQALWKQRNQRFKPEGQSDNEYFFGRSSLFAEFSKIVCISVGFITFQKTTNQAGEVTKEPKLRIKSFCGHDEAELLTAFLELLTKYFNDPSKFYLCGHNISEFDVPILCRRMIINNLPLPSMLNVAKLKPWEQPFIDTMKLWRFGDRRNYTSLRLLTQVLGLPDPKTTMEGNEVADIYWKEKDLGRIQQGCEKDTVAVARLFLRFKRLPNISDDQVSVVE